MDEFDPSFGPPKHMLDGVIDDQWLPDLPNRILLLAQRLELPTEVLTYELESLDKIQAAIEQSWLDRPLQMQVDFLLGPLLAYCGEIVRRKVNGQWDLVTDRVTGTVEPWIVVGNDRRYAIPEVARDFFKDLRDTSIRAGVEYLIDFPQRSS